MIKKTSFLLFVSLLFSPQNINSQFSYFFETNNPNNAVAEELFTNDTLRECITYNIKVTGNYSIWTPGFWTAPCGSVDPAPLFPSTSGPFTTGGNVGFDMEYIYSLPNAGSCGTTAIPVMTTRIEISTDNGVTWFHPITTEPFNLAHEYNYEVKGMGFPLGIRHVSAQNSDDYGRLLFEMDSIHKDTIYDTIISQICDGDYYYFGGMNVTAQGLYDSLIQTISCDTFITLDLQILNHSQATIDTTICYGSFFYFNGSSYSTTGTYYDTLTNHVGCDSNLTINLTVEPLYSQIIDTLICPGDTLILSSSPVSEVGLYQFNYLTSNDCDSVVEYRVTQKAGCDYNIFVPNTFTPDSDGKNEIFIPKSFGINEHNYTLTIFNKWGLIIFKTDKLDEGWDGIHKGKPVKPGTYVWKISAKSYDGLKKIEKTGHINLIR